MAFPSYIEWGPFWGLSSDVQVLCRLCKLHCPCHFTPIMGGYSKNKAEPQPPSPGQPLVGSSRHESVVIITYVRRGAGLFKKSSPAAYSPVLGPAHTSYKECYASIFHMQCVPLWERWRGSFEIEMAGYVPLMIGMLKILESKKIKSTLCSHV